MLVTRVIYTNVLVYKVTREELGTYNSSWVYIGIIIVGDRLYIEYVTISYY
jgi:hypothetical protein